MEKTAKYLKESISEAGKWWSELSMNEQKKYTKMHPFYGKMDSNYVIKVKDGIKSLYQWLKENKKI